MALKLADRVRETTTTAGTGTLTLSGAAPTGYQTFQQGIGSGNTTYYTINANNDWEVGIGTYSTTGPTLTRDTVLASSANGAKVDFPAGTKDVFVTYPAEKAITDGYGLLPAANGGTGQSSYTTGDLVYASDATTLSKLADVATGNALLSGGVGAAPAYGKVGLTTHVSGTLGVGNGGTGTTTQFTAGSVVFAGASGVYSQDNANLFWDDTNNRLGIGTSSPGSFGFNNLVVNAASGNTGITISAVNTALPTLAFAKGATGTDRFDGMVQYINASSAMTFHTNSGTERMRITDAGNVGIGTSSPGSKLTVVGGAVQQYKPSGDNNAFYGSTSDTSNNYLRLSNTTGTLDLACSNGAAYLSTTQNGPLWFGTNNAERMRITAAGNVGIGLSAPSYLLHVGGRIASQTSTGDWALLNNASGGAVRGGLWVGSGGDIGVANSTVANGWFAGSSIAYAITNFSERMRIDSSGNVGIGTSNPSKKLEVGALGVFRLQTGSSTLDCTPTAGAIDGFVWNTSANCYYDWSTGSSSRMRIDSSGNVLVNTTTTFGKLSVYGTTGFNADTNAAISGSGSFKFRGTASGTTITTYDYLNYTAVQFIRDNGNPTNTVGSITCTDGSTSYNTSSDRRLKKDIVPAGDAGATIDAIEIVSHGWKASEGTVPFGVIAQDLHAVAPQAVHAGDAGEEVTEVWGVDYSKLVPMLVKEIQSLRARVAQLEGN